MGEKIIPNILEFYSSDYLSMNYWILDLSTKMNLNIRCKWGLIYSKCACHSLSHQIFWPIFDLSSLMPKLHVIITHYFKCCFLSVIKYLSPNQSDCVTVCTAKYRVSYLQCETSLDLIAFREASYLCVMHPAALRKSLQLVQVGEEKSSKHVHNEIG